MEGNEKTIEQLSNEYEELMKKSKAERASELEQGNASALTDEDQAKIRVWKKSSPEGVYRLTTSDGRSCWISHPDRATVGLGMTQSIRNVLAMVDVILQNCWLDGDETIKTDVGCHLGLMKDVNKIVAVKTVSVVKY